MRRKINMVGLIGLLALFAGLSSLLALFVTSADAWREHAQASWPEATADIEGCSVDLRYFDGPTSSDPTWWLECKIGFRAGADLIKTRIYSGHRSNPSQGYPEIMNQWVNDHPTGNAIVVRYNPTNLNAVIPARDYLPNGEPRTPGDLKLLSVLVVACAGLLTIVTMFRRVRP
jgi:hypothetical protein